jgi:hypothetical protein
MFSLIPTSTAAPGTIDDWMDAIDYRIKNIEETRKLAQLGRDFIMENYNIESDKMRALYTKAYF